MNRAYGLCLVVIIVCAATAACGSRTHDPVVQPISDPAADDQEPPLPPATGLQLVQNPGGWTFGVSEEGFPPRAPNLSIWSRDAWFTLQDMESCLAAGLFLSPSPDGQSYLFGREAPLSPGHVEWELYVITEPEFSPVLLARLGDIDPRYREVSITARAYWTGTGRGVLLVVSDACEWRDTAVYRIDIDTRVVTALPWDEACANGQLVVQGSWPGTECALVQYAETAGPLGLVCEGGFEPCSIVAPPQPGHSWTLVHAGPSGLVVYAEQLGDTMQWPAEFFVLDGGSVRGLGSAHSVAVNIHDNTVIMVTTTDGVMHAVQRSLTGEGDLTTQFVMGGLIYATAEWDAFGRCLYLFINSGTDFLTVRAERNP